jgi:hypothetical protein
VLKRLLLAFYWLPVTINVKNGFEFIPAGGCPGKRQLRDFLPFLS